MTYFNKIKFTRNFRSGSKIELKSKMVDLIMATRDLETLNLKFNQVMFNSLVFTWERNLEVTVFGIFSDLEIQINVLESYLKSISLKIGYDKKVKIVII